jgi:hypothetical protein
MAYAELAALRPRAGGDTTCMPASAASPPSLPAGRRFVAGFSSAIAASAVVLAYLGRFLPIAGSDRGAALVAARVHHPRCRRRPSRRSRHLADVVDSPARRRPGRLVGNVLASLKVTALVLFIVFGFAFGTGSFDNLDRRRRDPPPALALRARAVLFLRRLERRLLRGREVRDPGATCRAPPSAQWPSSCSICS